MPRIIAPATPEFAGYTGVHPISKGGFGASTEAGIKANLGTIDKTDTSTGGIVKIGEDGVATGMEEVTVIADFTTIFGPEYFNYTSATKYEITSYTPFKTYNAYIKELPDTDVIIQDEFIFVPKGIELDVVTLVVNGREIQINRIPSGIVKPSITVNGFRDTTYDYIQVVASEYKSEYDTAAGSVHVQVSTTANFSNIIKDETVDSLAAVDGVVLALPKSTGYYVRVRYSDANGRWGDWSESTAITAATLPNNVATPVLKVTGFIIEGGTEIKANSSKLLSKVGVTHSSSDWQISTNSGFTALVTNLASNTVSLRELVSTLTSTSETFYVRTRQRNSAAQVSAWSNVVTVKRSELLDKYSYIHSQIITNQHPKNPNSGSIGLNSYFTTDNKYLYTTCGPNIHIYKNVNDIWTLDTYFKIIEEVDATPDYIKALDNFIIASTSDAIAIFKCVDSEWVRFQEISKPLVATYIYGADLSISKDKKRIAINFYPTTINTGYIQSTDIYELNSEGTEYIFKRNYVAKTEAGNDITDQYFGGRCCLSEDGKYLLIGQPSKDYGFVNIINIDTDYRIFVKNPYNHSTFFGLRAYISSDNSKVLIISPGNNPATANVNVEPMLHFYDFNGTALTKIQELHIPIEKDKYTISSTGHTGIGSFSDYTSDFGTIVLSDFLYNGRSGAFIVVGKTAGGTWEVKERIIPFNTVALQQHGNRPAISRDGKWIVVNCNADISGIPSNIQIYKRQTEKFQKEELHKIELGSVVGTHSGIRNVVSEDGNRIVIAARNMYDYEGAVVVLDKVNGSWVKSFILRLNPEYTTYISRNNAFLFGRQIIGNRNLTRLIISANGYCSSATGYDGYMPGAIFEFIQNGSTWTQSLIHVGTKRSQQVGISLAGDADLNTFSFSGYFSSTIPFSETIYKRNTTTGAWTKEMEVPVVDNNVAASYIHGAGMCFNTDGTIFAISTTGQNAGLGPVKIYKKVSGSWTLYQELPNTDGTLNAWGFALNMSSDGNFLYVCNNSYSNGRAGKPGKVTIFKLNGNSYEIIQNVYYTDPGVITSYTGGYGRNAYSTADGKELIIVGYCNGISGSMFVYYKYNSTLNKYEFVKRILNIDIPMFEGAAHNGPRNSLKEMIITGPQAVDNATTGGIAENTYVLMKLFK